MRTLRINADTGEVVERDMTPEEIAAIPQPVPPPPIRVVPALAFLERLTADERIMIRRAARANEGLGDWLDMLRAAQEVDLDDPRTISGMNAMVNAGLLSPKRRDEVLDAPTPDEPRVGRALRR